MLETLMNTKKILTTLFSSLLFVLTVSALTACTKPAPSHKKYRPLTTYQQHLRARVHRYGVKVIKQGDRLRVIIPTDRFFVLQTTKVKPNRSKALKAVANRVQIYATRFPHQPVRVWGYTDNILSRPARLKWTRQYAQIVASYLWHAGVAKNRLVIRGLGAAHPIASNRYPAGTALNRRVEMRIH